ncbi:MAG: cysteine--tRNA ligase, partial [Acidimicrobiia bacterium]|nr:cysteine--tRNA ligase [Acidimicrobiia bacterium]
RASWDWTDDLLPAAVERLEHWRGAGEGDAAVADVRAALDDDLDAPRALDAVDEAVRRGQGASEAARLLGVRLQ